MSIKHHIPDPLLAAYAAGSLPYVFEVVIATHISMCDSCQAALAAHETTGGLVIESTRAIEVSDDLKSRLLQGLDEEYSPREPAKRIGSYPGPVAELMQGNTPRWRSLGGGVRQDILSNGEDGSVRLLFIPPGTAVPDHGHNGMELTLVLEGSFSDETGHFGVGDLEVAYEDLDHTPMAGPDRPCICLAATDAPLKFNSWLPRLLQPIFRI